MIQPRYTMIHGHGWATFYIWKSDVSPIPLDILHQLGTIQETDSGPLVWTDLQYPQVQDILATAEKDTAT